jgi:regulatory protein
VSCYTTALTLLSRRELSAHQLRERLARRKFDAEDIETTVGRLIADRTVDDRRVAVAFARTETSIKGRGRRRVALALRQIGVSADVAEAALDEVYGDVDEDTLLARAVDKRLKGRSIDELDDKARARLIRQLVSHGFELSRVLRAVRG